MMTMTTMTTRSRVMTTSPRSKKLTMKTPRRRRSVEGVNEFYSFKLCCDDFDSSLSPHYDTAFLHKI